MSKRDNCKYFFIWRKNGRWLIRCIDVDINKLYIDRCGDGDRLIGR